METSQQSKYAAKTFDTHIELLIPSKELEIESNPNSTIQKFRILSISDTHCFEDRLDLPCADLLVVPGDFTCNGAYEELQAFSDFLSKEKHKFEKIVVTPGNLSICILNTIRPSLSPFSFVTKF